MKRHFPAYRVLATRRALLVAALLSTSACLSDPGNPSADSESHFLTACRADSDCAPGFSCICNVCSVRCSDVDSCADVSAGATCVSVDTGGFCRGASAEGDFCGVPCEGEACSLGLSCRLGQCVGPYQCPAGSSWDESVGYCVTPWRDIPDFSGDQVCGPEYYEITLPSGMNEFRPRAGSSVTGGFLAAITTLDQETLWSFSPNGESDICNNLWGDDQGVWDAGVRRTAGPSSEYCLSPVIPPPVANFLRGCGIYSFKIQGRALLLPEPP